jgi:hypothetical protein
LDSGFAAYFVRPNSSVRTNCGEGLTGHKALRDWIYRQERSGEVAAETKWYQLGKNSKQMAGLCLHEKACHAFTFIIHKKNKKA